MKTDKDYFKTAAVLEKLKEDLKMGSLAPDEVQDALLQEGYSSTKAKALVDKWIAQNPVCGFELL